MNIILVYIDDDEKMKDDAFLDDIEADVDEIEYFEKPSEGLTYIKNHIDQNIVVILDWKFNSSSLQGEDILNDIAEISTLVPVIVFTGARIDAVEAGKMFKGHAFSCVPKDATTEDLVEAIKNAYDRIQNDIRSVMEKWILKQDEEKRSKPYMRSGDKVFTLNDILDSIRKQDEFGKETTRGILSLATELFTNNMREK
ncbi:MAG: response regulator [Bacteroidales bacterium]|nr:response regulator [Bacteroidales bacterium]